MFKSSHSITLHTLTALTISIIIGMWAYTPTVFAATRYIISADGKEVTDTQTRLIWRRCSEGLQWNGSTCAGIVSYFSHQAAFQQATAQAAATSRVWRLPNIKELSSIADINRNPDPAIDPLAFPATTSDRFWSSSPFITNSGYAWYVDFYDGYVSYALRYGSYAVRLVR